MTQNRLLVLLLSGLLVLALAVPAFAQDDVEVYADGLLNPRNMSFDAEGNLYVAEVGVAGEQMTATDVEFGASGQITRISPDGETDVVLRGLISFRPGNALGAHQVRVTEDSIWVLLGETNDFSIPYSHALIQLDRENNRIQRWIDLLGLELELDPDGNPNAQSNATDFAVAEDGTIYIANAGCNCLMAWTEADGLSVAAVWPHATDNPVPTSVAIGPDGDIYVGFLTGFPFPAEGSRIERWSGGELVQTYPGLTAVTGLLVTAEGTIYAVEYGRFDPATGWGPGRVVTVDENGITPVLEDLTLPYGIAQSPDGTIVVSVGSSGEGGDSILVVPGM